MPFLILPERNRCESLFSKLTVKTVQFCSCFTESDRSFIGAFRPDVVREIHQFFLYLSKALVGRHATCEIFLRILVHQDAYFFSSINSELRVTKR